MALWDEIRAVSTHIWRVKIACGPWLSAATRKNKKTIARHLWDVTCQLSNRYRRGLRVWEEYILIFRVRRGSLCSRTSVPCVSECYNIQSSIASTCSDWKRIEGSADSVWAHVFVEFRISLELSWKTECGVRTADYAGWDRIRTAIVIGYSADERRLF